MRERTGAAALALVVALGFALAPSRAEDKPAGLESLEKSVQEKVFPNGLRLLVIEKHTAPIVAMATCVDVGSVDENTGETGIAHLFEHMAFKGSTTTGGDNWEKEKPAIEKTEKAFLELKALRAAGASKEKIAAAEKAWKAAQDEAKAFVRTDEYSTLLQRNGGAGLNAFTSTDVTCYHVTLPANRLELWFELEAERFRDPVLREFYKERDAVKEERRMRVESSPYGQLEEEFVAAAFHAHPYGRPVIGFMCDLEALSATTAKKFFEAHYAPNHMTISLVGDVKFQDAVALAEKYFGTMPRGPDLDPLPTVEPPALGERRVEVESEATPIVLLGWPAVAARHDDTAPL
ncbi:insulinase family protein, partial [bacterium]|nr:insulinase family protein [bacterium]